MHADLLEQPPTHHGHHAAAAGLAGVVGAIPGSAHETSRTAGVEGRRSFVFELLEGCADVVAKVLEPVTRPGLAILDDGHFHLRRYLSRASLCTKTCVGFVRPNY